MNSLNTFFLLSWLYGKYDGLCSSLISREAHVSVWYFTLKIIRDSRAFFKAKPCQSCTLMNSFSKNASLMQTVKSYNPLEIGIYFLKERIKTHQ